MSPPRFNWKVFLVLWVAAILGVIAAVPYTLTLQAGLLARTSLPMPLEILIPLQILQNAVLFAVIVGGGMFLAYRVGLGAPILEAFFAGEPIAARVKALWLPAVSLGVIAAVVIIILDAFVFAPLMKTQISPSAPANAVTLGTPPPAWQGFLVSFYGGIDEEILMRLFLLSLLAFFGRFVSRTAEGQPTQIVLWVANVLVAIIFGLGHLPITSAVVTITPLVVARAIVLNGLGGLVFGYLYFKRGLESAMLSHFSADIVLHVIFAV